MRLVDRCENQRLCRIEASNDVFNGQCADPYLEVEYSCRPVRKESGKLFFFSEERRGVLVSVAFYSLLVGIVIVIVNSKLLKRHSKAKHRAPAYSRALRQIRGVFQRIVRGRLRSVFQRVRECVKSEVLRR